MSKRSDKKKRPVAFVEATIPGTIHEKNTGEVVMEPGRTRLVRAFSNSVEQCVSVGAPETNFRLMANKDGRIISAIGPIVLTSAETAFPGCDCAEDIAEADEALDAAGATRGNSPAGRALDWALRQNEELAQWRVARDTMGVFSQSLYGGIQFGRKKPERKENRVNIDIISSYPYQALKPLPRVRDAIVERGLRPNAVLILITGTQNAPALFSRNERGGTSYDEDLHGWYVKEEVDYHVAMGRVKVQRVLQSVTFNHFDKYLAPAMEHLFTEREKYHRRTPSRAVIKSALNGLLGKFASPISTWRTPRPLELESMKRSRKATTLTLGASSLIDDQSLAGIYPRHSNVIWTALTYARARVRLWEKMDEISDAGGKVLWVHTDCVIADIPPGYTPVTGEALGDWRAVE